MGEAGPGRRAGHGWPAQATGGPGGPAAHAGLGMVTVEIITWNVNSVRARLPRVIALLVRHRPDLSCLQEIKTSAAEFPAADLAAAGYQAAVHGQAGRNGGAVLARIPLGEVACGFPGDPVPEQARVLSVTAGEVRVVNVYVVNGREAGAPVAARCTAVTVDRDERKPTSGEGTPSDHAPLIITLAPDG